MKIIDLLNKIANDEEPKIKYDNFVLKYNKNEKRFIDKNRFNSLYEFDFSELNDEVEIIEEDNVKNKIEKVNLKSHIMCEFPSKTDEYLASKINEIIDYLKSKGE